MTAVCKRAQAQDRTGQGTKGKGSPVQAVDELLGWFGIMGERLGGNWGWADSGSMADGARR